MLRCESRSYFLRESLPWAIDVDGYVRWEEVLVLDTIVASNLVWALSEVCSDRVQLVSQDGPVPALAMVVGVTSAASLISLGDSNASESGDGESGKTHGH